MRCEYPISPLDADRRAAWRRAGGSVRDLKKLSDRVDLVDPPFSSLHPSMSSQPPELKNVLVIGLGFAGATAAKTLAAKLPASHRVVPIQESSFGYNPLASLRAATVPGWENKVTVPLTELFPAESRHLLLTNHRVVSLRPHSVLLEPTREIEFEYAIVATGSTYAFPCRSVPGVESAEATRQSLREMQEAIERSNSVLVVGGGPAGIEVAGEVSSQHPSKRVILVHSRASLMEGYNPKVGQTLSSQLERRGVEIHYSCRLDVAGLSTGPIETKTFNLSDGTSISADFVFTTFGCTPNSTLLKALDPALVDSTGHALVHPTLQLRSPPSSLNKYDHIFAPGDVNDIPENKLAGAAVWKTYTASANIISLINGGGSAAALKLYKHWTTRRAAISVGPDDGAGQVFVVFLWSWLVSWLFSRDLGTRQFGMAYNAKL